MNAVLPHLKEKAEFTYVKAMQHSNGNWSCLSWGAHLLPRNSKFSAVIIQTIDEKCREDSIVCTLSVKVEIQPYLNVNNLNKGEDWCALRLSVTALPQGNNHLTIYTVILRPYPIHNTVNNVIQFSHHIYLH